MLQPDIGDAFTSIDLSQGEPITIANAAGDMGVIEGYERGSNGLYVQLGLMSKMLPAGTTKEDCERNPALKLIYGQLKQTLLAQLYGQGLPLLSAKLGLDIGPFEPPTDWEIEVRGWDEAKRYPRYFAAKRLRTAVYSAMPETEKFIAKLKRISNEHRVMMTIAGRVVDVPVKKWEVANTNPVRHEWRVEAHKGVNYFCQGGQYDLMADAQIRIIEAGLEDAVYLMMHDELIASTSASRDIRQILQTPSERFCFWSKRTPILRTDTKDLGDRWATA
jgi:DNA polymerase-1